MRKVEKWQVRFFGSALSTVEVDARTPREAMDAYSRHLGVYHRLTIDPVQKWGRDSAGHMYVYVCHTGINNAYYTATVIRAIVAETLTEVGANASEHQFMRAFKHHMGKGA